MNAGQAGRPPSWTPRFVPAHRRRRDPFRLAQIAPSRTVQVVVCVCGHPRLIHRDDLTCLHHGCDCTAYEEAL